MEVYVATQPIFDIQLNVFGYEILYRNNDDIFNSSNNKDHASTDVITNTFNVFGIEALTNGKPAFIKFTESLISQDIATLFPKELLIIEITEYKDNNEYFNYLLGLKEKGYIIALDNFKYKPQLNKIITLADIIKIDLSKTSRDEILSLKNRISPRTRLLAEKVETFQQFLNAQQLGFTYFQGYFFSKPETHSNKDVNVLKTNYLELINVLNGEDFNIQEVSEIISRDVSLSYKLLQLVNSYVFAFRSEIKTINQAVIMLGQEGVKKWVILLSLKSIASGKPNELIRLTLIRAKFCENLAIKMDKKAYASSYFLTGLFSTLDAMMDKPMEEIISSMSIHDDIKEALVHQTGKYANIYKVVKYYETNTDEIIAKFTDVFGYDIEVLTSSYYDAINWYNGVSIVN